MLRPEWWTEKILTSSQPPLACVVLLLPVFRTLLVHFFRLQHKIDSPKFFHPQGDRHISPFSWGAEPKRDCERSTRHRACKGQQTQKKSYPPRKLAIEVQYQWVLSNFESVLKEFLKFWNLWNLAETVKFGQNFEIFSKVWNLVKFLKFGKNF